MVKKGGGRGRDWWPFPYSHRCASANDVCITSGQRSWSYHRMQRWSILVRHFRRVMHQYSKGSSNGFCSIDFTNIMSIIVMKTVDHFVMGNNNEYLTSIRKRVQRKTNWPVSAIYCTVRRDSDFKIWPHDHKLRIILSRNFKLI